MKKHIAVFLGFITFAVLAGETLEPVALDTKKAFQRKNEIIEDLGGQNAKLHKENSDLQNELIKKLRKENSDLRSISSPVIAPMAKIAVNIPTASMTTLSMGLKRSPKWIEDKIGKTCDHCGFKFPFHRTGDLPCYWVNQKVPQELSKCAECSLGHPLHKDCCIMGQKEFGSVMSQTQEQSRVVFQQPQQVVVYQQPIIWM